MSLNNSFYPKRIVWLARSFQITNKTSKMIMNSPKNVFYQLARYILCVILLLTALPFITFAGIFSLITDIPHIKIELGSSNVVESVYFKLTRDWTEEEPQEEEDEHPEDDEELIELSKDLSKLLFDEDTNIITTESILLKKINGLLDTDYSEPKQDPVPHHADLWALLGLDDDDTLTWAELTDKMKEHYHELGEEGDDSGNEADDEDDAKSARITGRVGGLDDNYPSTPVRSRSPVEPPDAPVKMRSSQHSPIRSEPVELEQLQQIMQEKLTLDAGVVTNLNDSELTQDHASSCETAPVSRPSDESHPAS